MKISAVLVTYNRIDLLKESIEALKKQSVSLNNIIIVDNSSTDGTTEYLKNIQDEKIIPLFLKENIGGAGGFNYGLKYFINSTQDEYVWIMDDDTIPNNKALEKFLPSLKKKFGFLASNVRWIDGSPCKMNMTTPTDKKNIGNFNTDCPIKKATFVSLFIRREVIQEVGYPIREFFIWGDDTEYTERISKKYACYFIRESIVTHKTLQNFSADITSDFSDISRVSRFFFAYRNRLYIAKKNGFYHVIKFVVKSIFEAIKIICSQKRFKGARLKIMIRGIKEGISFNPLIERI